MVNIIDMKAMRQLNLFSKITGISTRYIFNYNEQIVFCVQKSQLSKAIGPAGKNVRRISEILNKRIKILVAPRDIKDAKFFIEAIITPVSFNKMEIRDNEIIITAGSQNKAALLGRNKRRMLEMQEIVRDFFGKELRIM